MDRFVARHLKGVSRTYAIVIPMLPEPLDDAVGLAYLLFRIVDTLEDAPRLSDPQRMEALRALDAVLAAERSEVPPRIAARFGELAAERALMAESRQVLERVARLDPVHRGAIYAGTRRMIAGVTMMLRRSARRGMPYPAIRDARELRTYCYYVAGVVGAMLCAMFARHLRQPELLQFRGQAIELGLGLQLVNILKDWLKDSRQGRRYLPATVEGRVSHAEIHRAVLAEARRSLEQGVRFVLALPAAARGVRAFCGLPIAWGALTLRRAERDRGRAKIDRATIRESIETFQQRAADDRALPRWLHSLIRPAESMHLSAP
jgi:farnesyl-diphosphate farnesyltransferase